MSSALENTFIFKKEILNYIKGYFIIPNCNKKGRIEFTLF